MQVQSTCKKETLTRCVSMTITLEKYTRYGLDYHAIAVTRKPLLSPSTPQKPPKKPQKPPKFPQKTHTKYSDGNHDDDPIRVAPQS